MIYSTPYDVGKRPFDSGIINEFNGSEIIQARGYSETTDQFAEFFYIKR